MAGHFAEIEFCCAPDEVNAMLDHLRSVGDFVVLPWDPEELPAADYRYPDEIPPGPHNRVYHRGQHSGACVIWNRSSAPPNWLQAQAGYYVIRERDSDVIALKRIFHPTTGHVECHLSIDDYVRLPDGAYEPRSEASIGWFRLIEEWVKSRGRLAPGLRWAPGERVYVSNRARELMLASPEAEEWQAKLSAKRRRPENAARPTLHERIPYAESFELLRTAVSIEGRPKPTPERRPCAGDRDIGPSFFRTSLTDQKLAGITLPGTYVGRSELRSVSFAGSDLHLSTFNWSDFIDCDFSACDLSHSDMRACTFERCRFVGANLSACDLRGSAFEDCDFTDATLSDALVLSEQRAGLRLSAPQAAAVRWTEAYEEPEGG